MATPTTSKTTVVNKTVGPFPVGTTQTLTLPALDPTATTSDMVDITFSSTITGIVTGQNLDGSKASFGVTLTGQDSLTVNGVAYTNYTANGSASVQLDPGASTTLPATGFGSSTVGPSFIVPSNQPITIGVTDVPVAATITGGANIIAEVKPSTDTLSVTATYHSMSSGSMSSGSMTGVISPPSNVKPLAVYTAAQTFTIADATVGWSQALDVNQFDPSLGRLLNVYITITADIAATASVENKWTDAETITTQQVATVTATGPSDPASLTGQTQKVSVSTTVNTSTKLAAYDGTTDDAGTSGASLTGLSSSAAADGSLLDTGYINKFFVGGGTAPLTISSTGSSTTSGGPSFQEKLTAKAGAKVTVSYGYTPAASVPSGNAATTCFAAGTRIATPDGWAAVEALAVGDLVLIRDGTPRPVVWIGHRAIDAARHANPDAVRPIRIRTHAVAPSVPARDLLLSPDHAVFVANEGAGSDEIGHLVPVRYLVNGRTILRTGIDRVTYYHVELDAHAILLAENLPAESYLDAGDRSSFANGGPVVAMHPDFAPRSFEAAACAPLLVAGPVVAAIRARLADRSRMIDDARRDVVGRA